MFDGPWLLWLLLGLFFGNLLTAKVGNRNIGGDI